MPIVNVDADGIASYRASGILSCTRALVAARLGMPDLGAPAWMQERFDQGHNLEASILASAVEADPELTILPDTKDTAITPLQIGSDSFVTGHVDGLGTHSFHGPCVVEAKAFALSTWESWKSGHWESFPYYAWQTSIYGYGMADELGWMAERRSIVHTRGRLARPDGLLGPPFAPVCFVVGLKNLHELIDNDLKGDARKAAISAIDPDDIEIIDIDVTWITEPLVPLHKIRARVFTIEALAKGPGLPDTCVDPSFPCPYHYLHDDEPDAPTEHSVEITTALTEAVATYDAARTAEAKAKDLKAKAKADIVTLIADSTGVDVTDLDSFTTPIIGEVGDFKVTVKPPTPTVSWKGIVTSELPGFNTSPYESLPANASASIDVRAKKR